MGDLSDKNPFHLKIIRPDATAISPQVKIKRPAQKCRYKPTHSW